MTFAYPKVVRQSKPGKKIKLVSILAANKEVITSILLSHHVVLPSSVKDTISIIFLKKHAVDTKNAINKQPHTLYPSENYFWVIRWDSMIETAHRMSYILVKSLHLLFVIRILIIVITVYIAFLVGNHVKTLIYITKNGLTHQVHTYRSIMYHDTITSTYSDKY